MSQNILSKQIKIYPLLAILFLVLTSSCSLFGSEEPKSEESTQEKEDKKEEEGKKKAEEEEEDEDGLGSDYGEIELLFEGLRSYDGERYVLAKSMFTKLMKKHPASPLITLAELKSADSSFYGDRFSEAIGAYRDFIAEHSTHEAKPYAMYQIGRSFQLSYQGLKQDETPLKEAEKAYIELVNQFPNSFYTQKAKVSILECDKLLLKSERQVISFYLKTGKTDSAKARLEEAKKNYSHVPDADSILDFGNIEVSKKETKSDESKELLALNSETKEGREVEASSTTTPTETPTSSPETTPIEAPSEVPTPSPTISSPTVTSSHIASVIPSPEISATLIPEDSPSQIPSQIEEISPSPKIESSIAPSPNLIPLKTVTPSTTPTIIVSPMIATPTPVVPSPIASLLQSPKLNPSVPATIENAVEKPNLKELFKQQTTTETSAPTPIVTHTPTPISSEAPKPKLPEVTQGIGTIGADLNSLKGKTLGSLETGGPSSNNFKNSTSPEENPTSTPGKARSSFLSALSCETDEGKTIISLETRSAPNLRSSKFNVANGAFGLQTYQYRIAFQDQLSIVPPSASENEVPTNGTPVWTIIKEKKCQNTLDKIRILEKARIVKDPEGFEPNSLILIELDSAKVRKINLSISPEKDKISLIIR